MKILITGATGKLGGHLSGRWSGEHELILTARNPGSQPAQSGISWHHWDLSEPESITPVLEAERPDAIVHLAAVLGAACQQDPEIARRSNARATDMLAKLAAAHGVRSFLFASTGAVYDQTELSAVNEQAATHPRSVYAQTKLEAEQAIAARAASTASMRCVSLRIFNIYGPAFTDSLVYKLQHSRSDEPVTVFCPDDFYRDYVHVDDVGEAFDRVLSYDFSAPHTVINVGSGKATNTTDLLAQLRTHGISPSYIPVDHPPTYTWADIGLAKDLLGYAPNTSIRID